MKRPSPFTLSTLVLILASACPHHLAAQAGMEYEGIQQKAPVVPAAAVPLPAALAIDDTAPTTPIDPRLLGIAYSWSTINTHLYEHQLRTPFIKAFSGLRLPINRIGGAEGQAFRWKYAVGPLAERTPQQIEPWITSPIIQQCGPLEWVKTLTEVDPQAEFVIALNLLTDTPQDHADLVELLTTPADANPNGGTAWARLRADAGLSAPANIQLWELGNENDWAGQKKSISPEDYVARCKATIAAIRTVNPDARFAAHAAGAPHNTTNPRPFIGSWHTWHRLVLKELGHDIDYLVFHPYYNHGGVAEQESFITEIRNDIRSITGSDRIKLFFSEHGVWPTELRQRDKWPTTSNLRASLITGQFLLDQLRHPGSIAAVWSMNAGPWGMFYPNGQRGVYTTGISDIFRHLNEGLGTAGQHTLVASRLIGDRTRPEADGTTLAAAVTRNGSSLHVTLINLESVAPRELSLQFQSSGWQLVSETAFTADTPSSHNTKEGPALRSTTRYFGSASRNTHTIPSHSLVILKFAQTTPVPPPRSEAASPASNHEPRAQIWPIVRSSDPAGTLEALLAQSTTDGIIYYIGIARIARADNELAWDWSDIDYVLQLCHSAQKPVKLALLPGRWVPEWFYEKGAKKFTWSLNTPYVDAGVSTASAPVPWDDIYLSQLERLVSIAATRYAQHPALAEIQITGPALANGLEMNLNISATQAASIGYTPEKLITAWKRMLDHYATAFPQQKLSLALHNQIAGERTTAIAKEVLTYGFSQYGQRLGVLICYATWEPWFDRGNDAVDVWLDTPSGTRHEAQLIDLYSVKNTPLDKVATAINRACNLGANTLEVFSADLLAESYRQAIDAARRPASP